MKEIYRGYEIEVTRDIHLGDEDHLFMSIFRVSDGYCIEETYCGPDAIEDMIRCMKERVDAEIKEHGSHEP